MEEQRKKFGMELKPSLHKRLKMRSTETGRKLYEITEEAAEAFLARGEHAKADDPLTRGLSPENRARVVALIEMLSGESTGIEHLDLMKAPVIGYLDTWVSQTQKQASGRKQGGKHA